jgi:hypothetical protein
MMFFEDAPDIATVVLLLLIPFMPFVTMILLSKIFKVKVTGADIKVRTAIGRKYKFNVSDIASVKWALLGKNKNTRGERISIKTTSGKKLSVGNGMWGFYEMTEYILANVDSNKIRYNKHL